MRAFGIHREIQTCFLGSIHISILFSEDVKTYMLLLGRRRCSQVYRSYKRQATSKNTRKNTQEICSLKATTCSTVTNNVLLLSVAVDELELIQQESTRKVVHKYLLNTKQSSMQTQLKCQC